MRLVAVPNELSDAIHTAIDKDLDGRPCDDESRRILYGQLLSYYDEHGRIPSFSLTATEPTP